MGWRGWLSANSSLKPKASDIEYNYPLDALGFFYFLLNWCLAFVLFLSPKILNVYLICTAQCITLVDYYVPLFFTEISSIHPEDFCQKVNLCQKVALISSQIHEDSCGMCHHAVSEVLLKLKDPDTEVCITPIFFKATCVYKGWSYE